MATKKSKDIKSQKAKKPAAKKQRKKTISVHPHLAHAILSLKKLAPAEMEEVKALSAKANVDGVQSTGCWISDSGGEQHCIDLPPDVCTRRGGISVPTSCPNN
jgi:hypothetical protein